MTKSEILTLLAGDVDPKLIATAIAAESFNAALVRAHRKVGESMDFEKRAEWKKLLTVMEGTLNEEARIKAEELNEREGFKRERNQHREDHLY